MDKAPQIDRLHSGATPGIGAAPARESLLKRLGWYALLMLALFADLLKGAFWAIVVGSMILGFAGAFVMLLAQLIRGFLS